MIGQDERRLFHRMAIESKVIIISNKQEFHGVCKDLSSTGMSICLTDNIVQNGDKIEIKLGEEGSRFPPFSAQATVVRITEQDDHFIAALELSAVT
ncbi:pilus assembly protein PilZ [Psychromonas sp. PRT-SC03]|nr:pilus assembly protein PilZ [Psychromonas sp. PRT-SC03]